MNCREFLIEFEERDVLTETARIHLNDCLKCKKTADVQTRIWQMIECLETVDAPNDFNFRVKARIANAKQSDFQPRFLPVLRYVLPLSFAVLLFAFVVFNSVYFIDDNSVPQIAENNFQPLNEKGNEPGGDASVFYSNERLAADDSNPTQQSRETRKIDRNARFVAVKNGKELPLTRKAGKKDDFQGSRDLGSTVSNVNILPRGINSENTTENAPISEKAKTETTEQILSQMLGMEIVSENGSQKIASVKRNSVAHRSGIKTGDVIEAIDGKKLTAEPIGTKTVEAKKITVVRAGERIEISLRY